MWSSKKWCKPQLLAAVLMVLGLLPTQVVAQRPTLAEIQDMLAEENIQMPFYRWPDGAPISVIIITSGQKGACIDAHVSAIREQIRFIREAVPQLRNMQDAVVTDWLPTQRQEFPLLIALPTKNRRVVVALPSYARENDPRTRVIRLERYPEAQDAFRLVDSQIVSAYRYQIWDSGLEGLGEEVCQSPMFVRNVRPAGSLFRLLGGEAFTIDRALSWRSRLPEQAWPAWIWHANRMFLLALYTCPDKPTTKECLVKALYGLLNDPKREPPH